MSAAMFPAAPGRLSTTTVWPSPAPSGIPTVRAETSTPPPGAKPTSRRIGLVGYDCAGACAAQAAATAKPSDEAHFFTSFPPLFDLSARRLDDLRVLG